ncbi:MAG: ABC transporter ATP-binding protein, partial [Planctomycetia bacterium]|nr:ABC transporter ATP-binding protein [Planctomycetia bacterium]
CALLHQPSIVFLDEATSGTDPISRHEFWRKILDLADSGVAVIITTHFMDEAQYCDRILIMRDGLSIAVGSVDEICRQGGNAATLEEAFVNLVT